MSSNIRNNNGIRTNYIKANTNKTQQNRKCRLRLRGQGESLVILQEIKISPGEQMVYMRNPEFLQENVTRKILGVFEIQTDQLISDRRPNLVIVNNQKRQN